MCPKCGTLEPAEESHRYKSSAYGSEWTGLLRCKSCFQEWREPVEMRSPQAKIQGGFAHDIPPDKRARPKMGPIAQKVAEMYESPDRASGVVDHLIGLIEAAERRISSLQGSHDRDFNKLDGRLGPLEILVKALEVEQTRAYNNRHWPPVSPAFDGLVKQATDNEDRISSNELGLTRVEIKVGALDEVLTNDKDGLIDRVSDVEQGRGVVVTRRMFENLCGRIERLEERK